VRSLAGLLVVATYAALVIWLTWPLAEVATTHFPITLVTSSGDTFVAAWSSAHATRTLFAGASAFADAGIYHPTPNSLYYGETGFGALPLFAPIFLATGNPTLATNVVFLGGVVLTAASIHAVTRHWTGSHAAAFVAGVTFVTTRWVLWTFVSTAPTYAVLFYLAPIVLFCASAATAWRRTAGLGLMIALQGLTSVYIAVVTCAPIAVLALLRLARATRRRAGLHLIASLLIAVVLLAVPYWGYIQVRWQNPSLGRQSIYRVQRGLDTVLPGDPFTNLWPTALPHVAGALVIAGLIARWLRARSRRDGARRDEGWRHAGLWALVGLYFALTPHVLVGGVRVTLPHVVLAPLYSTLRASNRFGVTTLVAGSMLAGLAVAECGAWLSGRWAAIGRAALGVAVVGLLLVSYFRPMAGLARTLDPRAAYPTASAPRADDPVYEVVARSEGALLELPVCPSATTHAGAMYRAIQHRRPLLNGYHSYYPADFPARMALACRLPDADALAELVRTTDIGMILVHVATLGPSRRVAAQQPYACPPDDRRITTLGAEMAEWQEIASSETRRDLRLVARGKNGDLLFRVVRSP
jgi:hypothetical protein